MADTRNTILEVAERMVRSGGYNGFSFREIAAEVGIKSASVHHHFPTKEVLAEVIADSYSERFFAALGDPAPAGSTPQGQLLRYCEQFRTAFEAHGNACLCGILSNEAAELPPGVRGRISAFVDANLQWLGEAMGDAGGRDKAALVYAALEGAMGIAALKRDASWISRVGRSVCSAVFLG